MTTAAATSAKSHWRFPGWRALALAAAVGALLALGEIAILLLRLHGSLPQGGRPDGAGIAAFAAALLVLVPFEEWLDRGIVLRLLVKPVGALAALLISSAVFALSHCWTHPTFIQFLSHFVGGLVLGTFYLRTGSLWPPIALHFAHNATDFAVMYLLTSN